MVFVFVTVVLHPIGGAKEQYNYLILRKCFQMIKLKENNQHYYTFNGERELGLN